MGVLTVTGRARLASVTVVLLIAGCGRGPDAANEQAAAGAASIEPGGAANAARSSSASKPATSGSTRPELVPDRIPELLADFPLPDDVSLVAPPRYEFNRLIVGFRTLAREEDVAALLDAELEAAGYEISRALDIGPNRWVFTKEGREGLVDVEQAGNKTLLTINLFMEPAE